MCQYGPSAERGMVMMFKRKLACSFCRRSEAEVAKLVAGPRVYICDRCAGEAVRIMNESEQSGSIESTNNA